MIYVIKLSSAWIIRCESLSLSSILTYEVRTVGESLSTVLISLSVSMAVLTSTPKDMGAEFRLRKIPRRRSLPNSLDSLVNISTWTILLMVETQLSHCCTAREGWKVV